MVNIDDCKFVIIITIGVDVYQWVMLHISGHWYNMPVSLRNNKQDRIPVSGLKPTRAK